MSVERDLLHMVLLFHSPSPWNFEKEKEWAELQESLLSVPGNGSLRGGVHDVTTRRLCDLIRAALGSSK